MFGVAGASRCDDGHGDSRCGLGGDVEVVAGGGAICIDGVDDDFSGAESDATLEPFDGVHAGGGAGTVDEDFVSGGDGVGGVHSFDLGGEDDALRAEGVCSVSDDVGVADGHGIHRDFFGSGFEDGEHVVEVSDTAADGEGDEDVLGDVADGFEIDLSSLGRGFDVVEDDLVDLVFVELGGEGICRGDVNVVLELLGFGDTTVDDVEAGDEPFGEVAVGVHGLVGRVHGVHREKLSRMARPRGPLFSAWNWVAAMLSRPTIAANGPA